MRHRAAISLFALILICGLLFPVAAYAHNVSKRRWNLNLQSVRALVNGAAKRIRVCTSCIRSGKIQKAA